MEIVSIFAGQNSHEGLFSIKLEGKSQDEFDLLTDLWLDTEYLYDFFSNNAADLDSEYYSDKNSTVRSALKYTRDEAYTIFEKLKDHSSKNKLSKLFTPVHHKETIAVPLLKSQAYSNGKGKWLRIYAVKVSDNAFIVTGGGIKLVKKIQEKDHLIIELDKLNEIRNNLIEKGIITQDDFNSYEI